MKFILSLITLLITISSHAQYDKKLADSLGADAYGMRNYMFVILKTGPAKISDKDSINKLFRGHLANINRLAKEGKLIVAGPFDKNDKGYRGLFIFKAKNRQETEALLATDPAVKAKIFDAEIYPWYGSAALPMYLPYHEKVAKQNP